MANTSISNLTASGTLTGTEIVPVVQSGATVRTTTAAIAALASGGSGTVTSVAGTGTVNGITLTGTVTTSGSLTLGGTLSGVGLATQVSGTLPVANGGTGTTTPSLVAGTNVTISGTWPNQTINSTASGGGGGTVTSVAASVPAFLSIAGSPITTSGTLAITLSGTALPIANGGTGSTSTTFVNLTTNVTGTLPVANGGTGATTSTGSGAVVLGTSPTLNNPTITNYTESVVAIGTVGASNTIALTNGTVQTATLTASTATTFTMPTATAGKSFILLLKQAATTGNGTATFTGVKWGTAGAPTITATAGKMDIVSFVADGTNWYGSIAQGYTP